MTLAFSINGALNHPEMRIPRVDDDSFLESFFFHQPKPHVKYLYRCDMLFSSLGSIQSTTGRHGHRYTNDFGNIIKLNSPGNHLVGSIKGHIALARESGLLPRGLYFFSALNGARAMQLNNIGNASDYQLDFDRTIERTGPNPSILTSVSIISRVGRKFIPRGEFFADPIPQDSPCGILHVVLERNKPPSIPLRHVEFLIDNRWRSGLDVDFEEIIASAREGNVRQIIPPLPLAP